MRAYETAQETAKRFDAIGPFLNEKMRRVWAAVEASALGYGGVTAVAKATGISRRAITEGAKEVQESPRAVEHAGRVRREGGGRRAITEIYPGIEAELEKLIEPVTRGDPESSLLWTSKSVRKLAVELKERGFHVSYPTVAELLKEMDYSLQANRKTREGSSHPDRDAQFDYIYNSINEFQKRRQPVISVDTKKKELVGRFKNGGREWQKKGQPEEVNVYDFIDKELGKVAPYGVYDVARNEGWVNVGTDHDTAAFAVESIRRWWFRMGRDRYPAATAILITADGGGSNGFRVRLWKTELQRLVDETGIEITVCHLPPGTSKWNKIEHCLFSHISMNWRGKPLVSHEVIINLIASTRTARGLSVQCALDTNNYQQGIKVTSKEIKSVNVRPHSFHGEWNYTILPRRKL